MIKATTTASNIDFATILKDVIIQSLLERKLITATEKATLKEVSLSCK